MTPIRRILVPIDFSEGSEDALLAAMGLAAKLDAKIAVLHVHEAPTFMGPELETEPPLATQPLIEMEREITERLKMRLELFIRKVTNQEIPDLEIYERAGEPSKAIVEAAKDVNTDLIVMGTHGRTGLKHFVLGSVAERVVRHAPCPVLTVRLGERQAAA